MKIGNRCLILGGSGFIGKNLCFYFKSQGFLVTSFDKKNPLKKFDNINYIEGDFLDDECMKNIVQKQDIVIHSISTFNPGNSNFFWLQGYQKDLIQTVKLCKWLVQSDAKLIFLSSGGTIYGNQNIQPITEDVVPFPINHYASVKLSIENAIRVFCLQNDLKAVIARIANPYGPEQDFQKGVGFVSAALNLALKGQTVEIWGSGENIRDYIYIEDVCKCIYFLAKYSGEEMIFNVSSGVGISQNQVIQKIRNMGIDINIQYKRKRSVDVEKVILDNKKIIEMSGINILTFDQGLNKYIDYLKR